LASCRKNDAIIMISLDDTAADSNCRRRRPTGRPTDDDSAGVRCQYSSELSGQLTTAPNRPHDEQHNSRTIAVALAQNRHTSLSRGRSSPSRSIRLPRTTSTSTNTQKQTLPRPSQRWMLMRDPKTNHLSTDQSENTPHRLLFALADASRRRWLATTKTKCGRLFVRRRPVLPTSRELIPSAGRRRRRRRRQIPPPWTAGNRVNSYTVCLCVPTTLARHLPISQPVS
jgi:hypothetical protein